MVASLKATGRAMLRDYNQAEGTEMYGWAITLAIIALIAAILGFTGVAGVLADVALVIFVIALIGTVIFVVLGWKAAKKIV